MMHTVRTRTRAHVALVIFISAVNGRGQEPPTPLPWKVNTPIATVRRELYEKHPRPAAAALVSVFHVGPALERMEIHALEVRDDVPDEPKQRLSNDNGRTWSAYRKLPATLSTPKDVEVWEGGGCKFFDPQSNVLVEMWLRQINLSGIYHCFTYCRTSRDQGVTWSTPRQLKYESGEDFDPADPIKAGFLNHNEAYFGSNILPLRDGSLLHCVAHANASDDSENDKRPWRMGSVVFLGKWNAAAGEYEWTAGARVSISPDLSSRGLMEPEAAQLRDGRVLIIWRGSNTAKTPGRKWFSVSADGGKTLSTPAELRYDDGSQFYSPSSYHRMIRHSVTGKLYWIGNICPAPPEANSPRYPLILAEVEESIPALKKSTVTVLDDRREGQTPQVQYSNFSLLENRETHELELYMTLYGESAENIFSADNYKYFVTLK